jgi:hypothetical protein
MSAPLLDQVGRILKSMKKGGQNSGAANLTERDHREDAHVLQLVRCQVGKSRHGIFRAHLTKRFGRPPTETHRTKVPGVIELANQPSDISRASKSPDAFDGILLEGAQAIGIGAQVVGHPA